MQRVDPRAAEARPNPTRPISAATSPGRWSSRRSTSSRTKGPIKGKVTSVTHIRTVDATMFDNGNGMDAANVVANGPGRLETQPDRDQPVERIAIWQDKLYLQNEARARGSDLRKIVDLTGNRPCFIDKSRVVARLGSLDQSVAQAEAQACRSGSGWRSWLPGRPPALPAPARRRSHPPQ